MTLTQKLTFTAPLSLSFSLFSSPLLFSHSHRSQSTCIMQGELALSSSCTFTLPFFLSLNICAIFLSTFSLHFVAACCFLSLSLLPPDSCLFLAEDIDWWNHFLTMSASSVHHWKIDLQSTSWHHKDEDSEREEKITKKLLKHTQKQREWRVKNKKNTPTQARINTLVKIYRCFGSLSVSLSPFVIVTWNTTWLLCFTIVLLVSTCSESDVNNEKDTHRWGEKVSRKWSSLFFSPPRPIHSIVLQSPATRSLFGVNRNWKLRKTFSPRRCFSCLRLFAYLTRFPSHFLSLSLSSFPSGMLFCLSHSRIRSSSHLSSMLTAFSLPLSPLLLLLLSKIQFWWSHLVCRCFPEQWLFLMRLELQREENKNRGQKSRFYWRREREEKTIKLRLLSTDGSAVIIDSTGRLTDCPGNSNWIITLHLSIRMCLSFLRSSSFFLFFHHSIHCFVLLHPF